MALFGFDANSKWGHFAFVVRPALVRELARIESDEDAVADFVEAHALPMLKTFEALPPKSLGEGVIAWARQHGLELGSTTHPWLRERATGLVERGHTLAGSGAPAVIIDRNEMLLEGIVRACRDFEEVGGEALMELVPLDFGGALMCVCVSENVGLAGGFEAYNPVTMHLNGRDPWRDVDLHPAEPVFAEGAYYYGEGEALLTLASTLESTAWTPPQSREESESEAPAGALRFVDALSGEELERAREPLMEARRRYASACRQTASSGLGILSWIDKNPVL
jgi:hypothetical protein